MKNKNSKIILATFDFYLKSEITFLFRKNSSTF